jgi:LmbE family N-acetylglucosaminyl deacetylase
MKMTTLLAPDRTTRYRAWSPAKRLLGIWSHPDDEAYLAAGLMDETRRAGGRVTLLTVTDGELGFPADDARPPTERRRQRRRELHAAMATIGVHDIRLLGIADGGVSQASERDLIRSFRAVMADVRPDVIVTFGPDGITGHPDHVATSRLATAAWLEHGEGELWYAAKTVAWLDEWRWLHDRFGMWMTEEPTGVVYDDIEVDLVLRANQLRRKRAVLARHASQTAAVAEAMGEAEYRRWIGQETFRRPTETELAAVRLPHAEAVTS